MNHPCGAIIPPGTQGAHTPSPLSVWKSPRLLNGAPSEHAVLCRNFHTVLSLDAHAAIKVLVRKLL